MSGRRQVKSIAMEAVPTTRGRHVWKWLLAASLLIPFACLQVARSRAANEWERVVAHLQESGWGLAQSFIVGIHGEVERGPVHVFGNYLSSYRRCTVFKGFCTIDMHQYRTFFGTRMEAHISMIEEDGVAPVEVIRDILAEFDIELVVEP